MPARSNAVALVGIASALVVVDQLTKFSIAAAIGPGRPESRVGIVDSWLALEYTQNRGAAFGLLSGLAPILTVASIATLVGLLLIYIRQKRPPLWQSFATGLISGGAMGNIIDRVRLGFVVDFLSVGTWPNFNVADSAVSVGVLVLLWGFTRPAVTFGLPRATDRGI